MVLRAAPQALSLLNLAHSSPSLAWPGQWPGATYTWLEISEAWASTYICHCSFQFWLHVQDGHSHIPSICGLTISD